MKGQRQSKKKNPHFKRKPMSGKKRALMITGCVILALVLVVAVLWFTLVRAPRIGDAGNDPNLEPGVTRPEGIYNVLIAGKDKVALNTDTLILASLNTKEKKVNLLSIPRDTMSNVTRSNKKINAAYGRSGKANIDHLLEEIQGVTGIMPDNYVVIDLDGFIELIDKIGGVEVDVPRDMDYDDDAQDLHIHIKKGLQTLDGKTAMGFVRYRKGYADADLGRIRAQQLFLSAIAKKMMQPSNLLQINAFAEFAKENVKTDLSVGEMAWFGMQLVSIDAENDLQMFTLPGAAGMYHRLSYYIVNEAETLELINTYFNPYSRDITSLNLIEVNQNTGGGQTAGSSQSGSNAASAGTPVAPSDSGAGETIPESRPDSSTGSVDSEADGDAGETSEPDGGASAPEPEQPAGADEAPDTPIETDLLL